MNAETHTHTHAMALPLGVSALEGSGSFGWVFNSRGRTGEEVESDRQTDRQTSELKYKVGQSIKTTGSKDYKKKVLEYVILNPSS